MNVIQQEALAKALGTSRNELADMLVQQESLNSLKGKFNALSKETLATLKTSGKIDEATYNNLVSGKAAASDYYDALKKSGMAQEEIVKLLGEEATASLESQTAQQKFNDTLEKVKESFSKAFTGETIDKFATTLADFVKRWSEDGLFSAIFSSPEPTGDEKMRDEYQRLRPASSYEDFKKQYEAKEAKSAPKVVTASDFVIKTLPEDTVTAAGGTNLGRTDEMVNLLKDLISAVKDGGSVYLDADKVGTTNNKLTFKLNS